MNQERQVGYTLYLNTKVRKLHTRNALNTTFVSCILLYRGTLGSGALRMKLETNHATAYSCYVWPHRVDIISAIER